jgi:large subunit ribosomal protein L11
MNQRPIATIRLTPLANRAAPSPILGQALGQYGINIMDFCKKFNSLTKNTKEIVYVPTSITVYSSNQSEITIKTPTTRYPSKQVANVSKGSPLPKKKNLEEGFIPLKEIYHSAISKKCDRLLNHSDLHALCRTFIGTAKSMGLAVTRGHVASQVGSAAPRQTPRG